MECQPVLRPFLVAFRTDRHWLRCERRASQLCRREPGRKLPERPEECEYLVAPPAGLHPRRHFFADHREVAHPLRGRFCRVDQWCRNRARELHGNPGPQLEVHRRPGRNHRRVVDGNRFPHGAAQRGGECAGHPGTQRHSRQQRLSHPARGCRDERPSRPRDSGISQSFHPRHRQFRNFRGAPALPRHPGGSRCPAAHRNRRQSAAPRDRQGDKNTGRHHGSKGHSPHHVRRRGRRREDERPGRGTGQHRRRRRLLGFRPHRDHRRRPDAALEV